MVRPDLAKWNQSLDDLLKGSIEASHARTRERYLALYMIASGQANATVWAQTLGRENETVMNWVHNYNERGPDALIYRRTGGSLPLFSTEQTKEIVEIVEASSPNNHQLPGHGWTLKKLVAWVEANQQRTVCRNTIRKLLHRYKLSWKQCKKLLASPNISPEIV